MWFVGWKDNFRDVVYDDSQVFLPEDKQIESRENEEFLSKFIREHRVDIVINQNCSAASHVNLLYRCGQQTGVKVIFCFHNSILTHVYNYAYTRQFYFQIQGRSWLFRVFNNCLVRQLGIYSCIAKYYGTYRNLIRKNDAVVLLCEGQVKELERASGIRPLKNAHVIYNSMEKPRTGEDERKKHVLWVGNFDYHIKRPDNMLRVWSKIETMCPDWKLYMIGDGNSLAYCQRMSKDMALQNVCFTGRVKPENYYRKAEVLCTTSVHECFPMVLLEGLNYGLALMAFNSFTSAKLLVEENGNGKLIKPFNVDEYAKVLMSIIQDDKARQRMQCNAARAANHFSEEQVYGMWKKLFNEIK